MKEAQASTFNAFQLKWLCDDNQDGWRYVFEQQCLGFLAKICNNFVNECYLKLWE